MLANNIKSQDDLEREATELIRANGGFGSAQGIYTDRQLDRMRRKHEVSLEDVYCEARGMSASTAHMRHIVFDGVWPDLQQVLSEVDVKMLEWMRDGKTESEMSEAAGVSERAIRYRKAAVLRRLVASADPYWWVWVLCVLLEVFCGHIPSYSGRI